MILINLGIDIIKYNHFKEYINCIPKEYCADWKGNTILQREWNVNDANFCLSFALQAIINIQENEYNSIHEIPEEYKNCYMITKFNDIDVTNKFSKNNCSYFSDSNKYGYSFYLVGKTKFNKLRKLLNNNILCKNEVEKDGEKILSDTSQYIRINSKYIKLISNEPAIWEIYLDFDYIPFTRTDNINNNIVNIDEIFKIDLLKKKDRDIIMNYLPLDSIEKAFELKSKLIDYYNLSINSLSLLKKLKQPYA